MMNLSDLKNQFMGAEVTQWSRRVVFTQEKQNSQHTHHELMIIEEQNHDIY